MTDKIIIDGVDVAECEYYEEMRELPDNLNGGYYIQHCYCGLQGDNYCICNKNPDCYYKQLKRLQAENKRLQMLSCANCGEQYLSPDGAELYEKNVQLQAENEAYKNSIIANHDMAIGKRLEEVLDENELMKRLLNDILRIFHIGQYNFLADQNEIIDALEKAKEKNKDFWLFAEDTCELVAENERLKKEVETWKNLKPIDITEFCQTVDISFDKNNKYRKALEEIREDLEQDTTCESRECGCDDYGECLNCVKETILDKISEVLK